MPRPKQPPRPPLRSIEERNALVVANLGLVYFIAKPILRMFRSKTDDIIQAGNVGLIKAGDSWDETRGVAFTTYACVVIRREIQAFTKYDQMLAVKSHMAVDAMPEHPKRVSASVLQEVVGNEDRSAMAMIESECGLRDVLNGAIGKCRKEDREILLRRANGEEFRKIGLAVGMSHQLSMFRMKSVCRQLRRMLPPIDELL